MHAVPRGGGFGVLLSVVVVTACAIPAASAVRNETAASGGSRADQKKSPATLLSCAHRKSGQLRLVRRVRGCRKTERLVRLSLRGPRGARGPGGPAGRVGAAGSLGAVGSEGPRGLQGNQGNQGPAGPQGLAGPEGESSVAAFSARLTGYSGLTGTAFASPSGATAVNTNEDLVETLAPARNLDARNLAVQTTSAPGPGNTITVTLRAAGADTALSCTIADAATSCTNVGTNALIPAASTLSLEVSSTPTLLLTSLLVGFETH